MDIDLYINSEIWFFKIHDLCVVKASRLAHLLSASFLFLLLPLHSDLELFKGVFEYFCGLLEAEVEGLYEDVHLLFRVLRLHIYSQSGMIHLHDWVFDSVAVNALIQHQPRHDSANELLPNHQG